MKAQAITSQRSALGNVAPSTYRIRQSREVDGSLSVTVETSQLLQVRRAIVQSGCTPVGIVRAVPLACGTKVRLLIAVRPEYVHKVMDSIMRTVAAGEFAT
jgi:hypothetical protein